MKKSKNMGKIKTASEVRPITEREYRDYQSPCRHEWRIIENFHEELPRDLSSPRKYAVYCVHCLTSKGVEVKINK